MGIEENRVEPLFWRLTEANPTRDPEALASMARQIWTEHFTPIIGESQVAYMLELFQSPKAIRSQIQDGYRYFFIDTGSGPQGYCAVQVRGEELFLSKLYVLCEARGRGAARATLAELRRIALAAGCRRIRLTVNRHNMEAVRVYEHLGFQHDKPRVADIGGGYVMDDFVLVLNL